MKICAKCGISKPEECFSKNVREKDGLKRYCKECVALDGAKYREQHRDEVNARKKISYMKSKERAEERTAEQAKALHKTRMGIMQGSIFHKWKYMLCLLWEAGQKGFAGPCYSYISWWGICGLEHCSRV